MTDYKHQAWNLHCFKIPTGAYAYDDSSQAALAAAQETDLGSPFENDKKQKEKEKEKGNE